MNHRILLGSYPIPRFASVPHHNFLVWVNHEDRPLFEINGGAANPDGSFNYAAIFGRLTAVETDYSERDPVRFPEFYIRPTSRSVVLMEAPCDEIGMRWTVGVEAARRIAASGLRYSILTRNSNSVATAVARGMDIALPPASLGLLRAPGARRPLAMAADA